VFSSGESPSTVVAGITIVGGYAEYGGAVYCEKGSSPRFVNCIVKQCIATLGGAVCTRQSSPTMVNCMFSGNTALHGGAICTLQDSDPRLVNCTLVGNKSLVAGGGAANDPDCEPLLVNCILWQNVDSLYMDEESQVIGGNPIVNNCAIQGWTGRLTGIGSHGQDPQFTRAGNWTLNGTYSDRTDDSWAEGDYHCLATSPCVDAGDNLAIQHTLSDLDGNPRIVGKLVDMGTYECQSPSPGDK
jgi:predicted outer membrane repeat protein